MSTFIIQTDDRDLYHSCVEKFDTCGELEFSIGGLGHLDRIVRTVTVVSVKYTKTLSLDFVSLYPYEIVLVTTNDA